MAGRSSPCLIRSAEVGQVTVNDAMPRRHPRRVASRGSILRNSQGGIFGGVIS